MDLELSDQSNEEEHKSEHHHSAGSAGSAEEPNPPFATEQQLTCFLQKVVHDEHGSQKQIYDLLMSVLRSKSSPLLSQEFDSTLLAHFTQKINKSVRFFLHNIVMCRRHRTSVKKEARSSSKACPVLT